MSTSMNTLQLKIGLELIWWFITALVVGGVLYPVLTTVSTYPFLSTNIIFIVAFITFARYIFQLKHSFLAHRKIIKVVIFFLLIPAVFLLIQELNSFQTYLDYYGVESLIEGSDLQKGIQLEGYLKAEMLFFGVGSVIAAIVFGFRLLISVWRNLNLGTA
jgi:hypothetical protein